MDEIGWIERPTRRTLATFVVALLFATGCGSPDPSRIPSAAPTRSALVVAVPTATATEAAMPDDPVLPADRALVRLAPGSLRSRCVGTDLGDAKAEIVCADGGVELYLARWPSKATLAAAYADDLDAECALLDRIRGTYAVASKATGRGGGCVDGSTFSFTNERRLVQGSIFMPGATAADTQDWFSAKRPTLPAKGRVTGSALGPPIGELGLSALRKLAKRVPYNKFARNVEDYAERLVSFSGRVLQVTGGGALVEVTKDRSGGWRDLVFVDYTDIDRVLDGDLVSFVGTGGEMYEYVTVLGADKEVPKVDAIALEVR